MRIAQICPYDLTRGGGVKTHISFLSRELVARGHEVTIFGPAYPNQPLDPLGDIPVKVYGRPAFNAKFNKARIPIMLNIPKIFSMISEMEGKYDVVHVHEPIAILFSLFTWIYGSLPTVGSWHCHADQFGFMASGIRALYNLLRLRPAVGEYTKLRIQKKIAVSLPAQETAHIVFPGEYEIIPNGIDADLFSKPTKRPSVYSENDLNLLFVGRLDDPRKGLPKVLEAYATLKYDFPNLKLTVIGSGERTREAWAVTSEHGLNDVQYLGWMANDQLPALFQHADIFCAPNSGGESFGIVLNEAMAAGTAIVASNIPGFISTGTKDKKVEDLPDESGHHLMGGEGAIEYFDVNHTADLIRVLRNLLGAPKKREQMAQRGREYVKKFTWSAIASDIERIYQEAIELHAKNQNGQGG